MLHSQAVWSWLFGVAETKKSLSRTRSLKRQIFTAQVVFYFSALSVFEKPVMVYSPELTPLERIPHTLNLNQ